MRKLLKSLAFIVLAISFLVSAAGCNIANRYVLDRNAREAVTSVGLDPKHEGLRIEQIYDDYEMGDGVKIYKLSFGEKAAALFEDWIELTEEHEDLDECLYLAGQAWVTHGIKHGRWIMIDRESKKPARGLSDCFIGIYNADENIAYVLNCR